MSEAVAELFTPKAPAIISSRHDNAQLDLEQVESIQDALKIINALPEEERLRLSEILLMDPATAIWCPSPGPQMDAYASTGFEVFYGGAAGGGKSSLIIGLALTQHQRSLILRLESTQLRGMIDDIANILGTRDGLNKQEGQWRIPKEKALFPNQLIEFGGVPDPGSEEKHQGIPHDLLAFDEVTQLPEYVVDYLSSWCRSTRPGQRCRMVLTSNPPTPSTQHGARGRSSSGGLWLLRRYAPWLDPQYRDPFPLLNREKPVPGELRYFTTINGLEREHSDEKPFKHRLPDTRQPHPEIPEHPDNFETITPKSRTFIPARVSDNPYLASTSYESTLQKLSEPLRSAMLYGDFSVSLSDRPMQLIPAAWLRAATARWEAQTVRAADGTETSPRTQPPCVMTSMGCDVSRGGGDSTILQERYGSYFPSPKKIPSVQTLNGASVAAKVIEHRRDNAVIVVDANGVGASVFDHLRNNTSLQDEAALKAYVGSSKSKKRDRSGRLGFNNLRSQAYWAVREALDPTTPGELAIPPDEELIQELLVLTYTERSGMIHVLPKEDVIKILGRSSDKSDALGMALTVHDEGSQEAQIARNMRSERLEEARAIREADSRLRNPLGRRAGHLAEGRRPRWGDRYLPYPKRY